MFSTLLLATVVGAGVGSAAVNAPAAALDARTNSPPSYFCSSNTKKCSKQKDSVMAYCSSYLSIPKATRTVTKTVCSTKTNTITQVTGTITSTPKAVTSTMTSCAPPVITMAPVDEDDSGDVSDGEGSLSDVDATPVARRGSPAGYKPSCLDSQKDRSAISAACRCYSIKPSTTTVTKTISDKKTTTKTIRTATTVMGTASTTFVFPPEPTFLIANDRGGYAMEECVIGGPKQVRSGLGRLSFEDETTNALLFALNADKSLTALEGSEGDAFEITAAEGEDPDYSVRIGGKGSLTTVPLSCSISQGPDGTCPLDCTASGDGSDVNQGNGFDGWILGPPNTVTDLTYRTYAVTRGDPSQRGGGGCFQPRGRSSRKKR